MFTVYQRSGPLPERQLISTEFDTEIYQAPAPHFLDSRWLLAAICCALFGFVAMRAATLSIVHDEALTYLVFVKRGFRDIVTFHAPGSLDNNHMLNTLLAKLSVGIFGLHEFALRLPSIAGCALFLACFAALLRPYLRGALFWLFFLAGVVNPFVLDFMGLARGYGPGIALSIAALHCVLRSVRADDDKDLRAVFYAEGLLALAVLAHFAFLLLYLSLLSWRFFCLAAQWRTRLWATILKEALFTTVLSLALLGVILRPIGLIRKSGLFTLAFEGRTSFFYDTIEGMVEGSLYRFHYGHPLVSLVAILTCVWVGCAAALLLWRARELRHDKLLLSLAAVTYLICATAVGNILQHYILGTSFLFGRNAAFFAPLLVVMTALLVANLRGSGMLGGVMRGAVIAFTMGLVVLFGSAENLGGTHVWAYDSATRSMMHTLAAAHDPADPTLRTLGAEWFFEPTLNFYIEKYHMTWLKPVTRQGPAHDYDFYYVTAGARSEVEAAIGPLRVLATYPKPGTLLAVRSAVREPAEP